MYSNHIDWPYLYTETTKTVGSAHGFGRRELTAIETNRWLQTKAQQESNIKRVQMASVIAFTATTPQPQIINLSFCQ